jgi:hypothetical protein
MEPVTSAILKNFLSQLGERLPAPASLYLLGGSALGLLGSSRETLDVDYFFETSSVELEQLVATLSEEFKLDLEVVPLKEFIPLPPNALQRRRFFASYGMLDVYIYDLYSIALSKIARGFDSDFDDVLFLLEHQLINFDELEQFFLQVLPNAASKDIITSEFKIYFAELKRRIASKRG